MTAATVHIVFGSQGGGKTTYARKLADETASVRFSIDEWMGELFGPDVPKPMNLPWILERVQRCERRIWSTAAEIVERGAGVVLDLGFMKVNDRSRFVALAEARGLPVRLHFVTAPHELRRERVMSRNASRGETFAFEVTPAMFDFMETQFEPPTEAELSNCVASQSSEPPL
jgi:predicted kinase